MNVPRGQAANHHCHEITDGYKHLQAHVSTNAFSKQQKGEAPKCHPNTRVAVLNIIMTWVLVTLDRISQIMWIFGPAGAGKSAIARSIVDICLEQHVIIARFFFYRTDGSRNTLDNLVATLAFQLIQALPELHPIVIGTITANSLIFNYSLEDQLRVLIFEPLRELHRNNPITKAIVLLFDGVDEIKDRTDQVSLIREIHQFITTKSIPVIALFFSRPEVEIKSQFHSRRIRDHIRNLALDNDYQPNDDIKKYLNDSFEEIHDSHPLAHLLPGSWPPKEAIQTIVHKSSGQFIFASVAVGYISDPRANPATRLEIILGIRPPPGNDEPFAELDALYRHLLSQVIDLPLVLKILATSILIDNISTFHCADLHDASEEEIEIALVDLTSVVQIKEGSSEITFSHASLPDFLLDPTRSGACYIDRTEWSTQLSILCLMQKPPAFRFVCKVIRDASCDNALREAVLTSHQNLDDKIFGLREMIDSRYLSTLQSIDFGDGYEGEVYQQTVINHTRLASMISAKMFHDITSYHNPLLSGRIVQQFWKEEFSRIKLTHPFRHLLCYNWPEKETVQQLITKSQRDLSYGFVSAAHIALPRKHPALQLQVYLSGALLDIDALYRHILSQVSDPDYTQLIFTGLVHRFGRVMSLRGLGYIVSTDEIRASLEELTPLVHVNGDELSCAQDLYAFFEDQSRSLNYHIGERSWRARISRNLLTDDRLRGIKLMDMALFINSISYLIQKPHQDDRFIYDSIQEADANNAPREIVLSEQYNIGLQQTYKLRCEAYLDILKLVNFGDGKGGKIYKQKVFDYARWASRTSANIYHHITSCHDILLPDHLVQQFWTAELARIKQTHPFRCLLPETWPEEEIVQQLLIKSPRQLSYAHTAAADISMPRRHPAYQLQSYQSGTLWSVDTLYRHILSQVPDLDGIQFLLSRGIVKVDDRISIPLDCLPKLRPHVSNKEVRASLVELPTLLAHFAEDDDTVTLSPSFRAFLLDEARSLNYHIDITSWRTSLAVLFLTDKSLHPLRLDALTVLIRKGEPTPNLLKAIVKNRHKLNYIYFNSFNLAPYLLVLKHKDFGDEGKAYRMILDQVVRWVYANQLSWRWISRDHEIQPILDAIDREEMVATASGHATNSSESEDMPHL